MDRLLGCVIHVLFFRVSLHFKLIHASACAKFGGIAINALHAYVYDADLHVFKFVRPEFASHNVPAHAQEYHLYNLFAHVQCHAFRSMSTMCLYVIVSLCRL